VSGAIDLHAHLLPAVDDGPADDAGAVALASALVADGVATVAATPHLRALAPAAVPEELADRGERLRGVLASAGVAIEVVSGAEVDLLWALGAGDEQLRLASYGQAGRDLLVETPYGGLPAMFEDQLFSLTVRGFRVTLAHPERNRDLQRDPARIVAIAQRGVLLQVTAGALAGGRRSASARLARSLVQEGLAHLVASDAHEPSGDRGPAMTTAAAIVEQLAPGRSGWLMTDVPRAVLAGAALPAPPRSAPARRSWFGRPGRS
jgi:protein-tyrosine phosphatase